MVDELPKGIVLAWVSKEQRPPKGWLLCDGQNGTPDLTNRWLVGTTDHASVGDVINQQNLIIPVDIGGVKSGIRYGEKESNNKPDDPPHVTGFDHAHSGSLTITDRVSAGPPSFKVRYIIKV